RLRGVRAQPLLDLWSTNALAHALALQPDSPRDVEHRPVVGEVHSARKRRAKCRAHEGLQDALLLGHQTRAVRVQVVARSALRPSHRRKAIRARAPRHLRHPPLTLGPEPPRRPTRYLEERAKSYRPECHLAHLESLES